jgi:hypothetical protein
VFPCCDVNVVVWADPNVFIYYGPLCSICSVGVVACILQALNIRLNIRYIYYACRGGFYCCMICRLMLPMDRCLLFDPGLRYIYITHVGVAWNFLLPILCHVL